MTGLLPSLIAFTFAAALITVTPGLDTALVLRTAAAEGGRRAFLAGLGICLGCLVWGVLVALGLGILLAASELAYTILRWAGAAYLAWLAAQLIFSRRGGLELGSAERQPAPAAAWLRRGLLTNLLNPKVGVFYVSFLPQFVPTGANVAATTLLLAVIHALLGLLWFLLLIAATRPLATALRRPRVVRLLDRATGGVFLFFAGRLAFAED